MKKVLAICLMLAMLLSLSVGALAAPNGFVSSPSGSGAPTVEEFKPQDENCTATLLITPYGEREELPELLQSLMQKAYDSVVNAGDLTKLNADFAKLVAGMGLKAENLAISDLFDIHVTGCDFHDGHKEFDVVLKAETLKHFVALLHMNKNGQFELVSDAKVIGDHLHFSVESFSPFAIVVDTTVEEAPPTGDSVMVFVWVAVVAAVAFAVTIVVIVLKNKKRKD